MRPAGVVFRQPQSMASNCFRSSDALPSHALRIKLGINRARQQSLNQRRNVLLRCLARLPSCRPPPPSSPWRRSCMFSACVHRASRFTGRHAICRRANFALIERIHHCCSVVAPTLRRISTAGITADTNCRQPRPETAYRALLPGRAYGCRAFHHRVLLVSVKGAQLFDSIEHLC